MTGRELHEALIAAGVYEALDLTTCACYQDPAAIEPYGALLHDQKDALDRAAAKLNAEPQPGVMHEMDRAFYDLAVQERDIERRRVDRLRAQIERGETATR